MSTDQTDQFYAQLPSLRRFIDVTDYRNFLPVPTDWYVLATDIVGSTAAIAAGRYREVNFVGASAIMAVLNALPHADIPFVFGGDGATLLIPSSLFTPARQALLATRRLAREIFHLDLRVAVIPVARLYAAGYPLQIAKVRVSSEYHQAAFLGGGLTYATTLLKADPAYQLEVTPDTPLPNLSGLECRWQDIPSPYGQAVTLMVQTTTGHEALNTQVYRQVLQQIRAIYGAPEQYHPVHHTQLALSFNPQRLLTETKARARSHRLSDRLNYLCQIWLENALGSGLMRWKIRHGEMDWGHYRDQVVQATDYQKIDDLLRMVIVGTAHQTRRFSQYLEQEYQAGRLVYGLHLSDRVQMTCLILQRCDRHVHFVDGADGGYTVCAQAFKQRLQQRQCPLDRGDRAALCSPEFSLDSSQS